MGICDRDIERYTLREQAYLVWWDDKARTIRGVPYHDGWDDGYDAGRAEQTAEIVAALRVLGTHGGWANQGPVVGGRRQGAAHYESQQHFEERTKRKMRWIETKIGRVLTSDESLDVDNFLRRVVECLRRIKEEKHGIDRRAN